MGTLDPDTMLEVSRKVVLALELEDCLSEAYRHNDTVLWITINWIWHGLSEFNLGIIIKIYR